MDDLIGEFITETTESLQTLDSELVKLEQNPDNALILRNIFRLVHTIKGTCGFLGLPRLESIAHASENVLGKIRDKVIMVSPQAITLILESLDCIKRIIGHLANHEEEPEGEDSALITRLNIFADTGTISCLEIIPAAAQVTAEDIMRKARETAIAEGLATDMKEAESPGSIAGQSIRVNLDVLDNLMQMVGELVLTRNQLMQLARSRNDHQFLGPLQQLSHLTTQLQDGVMKTRMQPIGNAWAKFPRLIRDLSHELDKKIDLRMVGAETELDRQLLEMIKDPLTHILRNCADHGIELPAERKAQGKNETGTITLSAFHESGHIIIEMNDDGRGLNVERIKAKALTNALATDAELARLNDAQIIEFIFQPGFSTAEKITTISGRGVGMDVVRNNIEKIGGTVELSSTYGIGSTFIMKIPLTLAIVPVLIVEAKGERFALPQINVREVVRAGGNSSCIIDPINNVLVLRLRDKLLPLISLPKIMRLEMQPSENAFVIVCRAGGFSFGLMVDRVFDTEEIVVKPCSQVLRHIPLYSGSTILGDGNVIMILDPNGLARAAGGHEFTGRKDALGDLRQLAATEHKVRFLLFKSGGGATKAVALESVARIEEIELSCVEHTSGNHPVIQYGSGLMRLCTLPGIEFPAEGTRRVIVFTCDSHTIGLIVDSIIDIVEAVYDIKISSIEKGIVGSMILNEKTTDVIDVAYLLHTVTGDNAEQLWLPETSTGETV